MMLAYQCMLVWYSAVGAARCCVLLCHMLHARCHMLPHAAMAWYSVSEAEIRGSEIGVMV